MEGWARATEEEQTIERDPDRPRGMWMRPPRRDYPRKAGSWLGVVMESRVLRICD